MSSLTLIGSGGGKYDFQYFGRSLLWTIDGQICLVRCAVCKQITSFCFLVSKRTNNKLLFARWANSKRIKENRLGFRFPLFVCHITSEFPNILIPCLYFHASISMSPCPCLYVHVHVHVYMSMSLCPCLHVHVSMSMSPCPCLHVHVSMSMFPCPCLHVHVSISMSPRLCLPLHVSISMTPCSCLYVHVSMSMYPCIWNSANGKRNGWKMATSVSLLQTLYWNGKRSFVCCKRKWETEVCYPWSAYNKW